MRRMVFDVESVGLHGEGFAVGWVVLDEAGREVRFGSFACNPAHAIGGSAEDRAWIQANVVPVNGGGLLAICGITPENVREIFWSAYQTLREEGPVELWADCPWPVEARFLNACIDQDREGRNWKGPYPLLDVATMMHAAGMDPMAIYPRLPSELPEHNPLADARQSARLLLEAEAKLRQMRGVSNA